MSNRNGRIEATVCHLLKGSGPRRKILLGKRLVLFCQNQLAGPGGKKKGNEGPLACVKREVWEEVSIRINPDHTTHVATIDFHYPGKNGYVNDYIVHFFNVTKWQGEPTAGSELDELTWHSLSQLPYARMLPDRRLWLPYALSAEAQFFTGEVFYSNPERTGVDRFLMNIGSKEIRET